MNNIVFLNDKFLPRDKAKVSVFDRGFIYGDGVFETLHSYNGKVFAFDLHFTRLSEGIKALAIPIRLKEDYLLSCIKKLLSRNNFNNTDANIRITVTRGTDYGSLAPSKSLKPTLAITAKPFNPKIKDYQREGVKAVFLNYKRPLPQIKSLNLIPNITGIIEAKKIKAQEGIFTNGDKILEGTITNIFISDGKGIKTPPIKDGILPGITRRLVIELAKAQGIKVSEVSLTRKDLKNCKEAFLTNSIMEIVPLVKIEDKLIGNGSPGTLTRRLQEIYKYMLTKIS